MESNQVTDLATAPFVEGDLAELVVLQCCCWVQEAILNNTLSIPALHESAADVLKWTTSWTVLCVRRDGRLVAAVRARATGDAWEIGRLMVAPTSPGRESDAGYSNAPRAWPPGAGPCALVVPFTDQGAALVLFVLASTLVVLGITAGNVVSASFRQRWVDPGMLSRVTTSIQVLNLGTIPLGVVSAGALANWVGTREALAVMTVAYAASGLMLILGPLRGLRNLPTRPPHDADLPA